MSNNTKEKANANDLLRQWLTAKKKSIAQFNRDMGYWSNYGNQLLATFSPRPITYDTIGRLLVAYGDDGPAKKIAEHMRALGWPLNDPDPPKSNGKARK